MDGGAVGPGARLVFHINQDDRITYVDAGWVQDAMEGGAPTLAHDALGTVLLDHVHGPLVKDVYRRLLSGVRQGKHVSFTFRCDAPSIRRLLEMQLRPLGEGGIAFETRTIFEIERQVVDLLRVDVPRAPMSVEMCTWCQRLRLPQWIEIEEAVDRLREQGALTLPSIHYTICDDDLHRFHVLIESLEGGTP